MSAMPRATLRGSVPEDLAAAVDSRTLEIVARRRKTAVIKRRGWIVRRMLLAADLLGLTVAFAAVEAIWAYQHRAGIDTPAETILFVFALPGWIMLTKLYGLYDNDEERADHTTVDDFVGVLNVITLGTWLFCALSFATRVAHPQLSKLLVFWILAVAFVTCGRGLGRVYARRQITYLQNAVVVGAGDVGQLIARKVLQHPEYGINLVGFVDGEPLAYNGPLQRLPVLGDPGDLANLVRVFDVDRVIVAFSNERDRETLEIVRSLKDLDVQIDIVPRLFELLGPSASMHSLEGLPLVGMPPLRLPWSSLVLKRMVDLVASAAGLILLAPLFALVALKIRRDSPGPVFYRHTRLGRDGKPIAVFKFRTMYREACRGDRYGGEGAELEFERLMSDPLRRKEFDESYKLQDDPRVTKFGQFLRKTSLDELPQLINVFRGELSLVGPRPITGDELERYGEDAELLLGVKPGVTGYWQINGRSDLDYQDRVRLDMAYVGGWSLGLDLTILAKTIRVLAARAGAY